MWVPCAGRGPEFLGLPASRWTGSPAGRIDRVGTLPLRVLILASRGRAVSTRNAASRRPRRSSGATRARVGEARRGMRQPRPASAEPWVSPDRCTAAPVPQSARPTSSAGAPYPSGGTIPRRTSGGGATAGQRAIHRRDTSATGATGPSDSRTPAWLVNRADATGDDPTHARADTGRASARQGAFRCTSPAGKAVPEAGRIERPEKGPSRRGRGSRGPARGCAARCR